MSTMGNLHCGHYSLLNRARDCCDQVVVSIFVNPLQFGQDEDFQSYPRTEQEDIEGCRNHGATILFIPDINELYPPHPERDATVVKACSLSQTLCGLSRPGHFDGVCTVVSVLFNIVQPDIAFFGEKDFQQVMIIRSMVTDLHMNIEIQTCPTIREEDGLACSSRNHYLDDLQRQQAPVLYNSLCAAVNEIERSHPAADEVIAFIADRLKRLAPLGEIDYIKVLDPDTLCEIVSTEGAVLLAIAVRFGKARLIDHLIAG